MKQLGKINLTEGSEQSFGFYQMPEHAGKTFLEAFPQLTEKYSLEALQKALKGEFYFDEEGLLRGSNQIYPTLMNHENLFPTGEHFLSIAEFGRAYNESSKKFKGTYQDTGRIIRESDSSQSQYLFDQIKKRGITPTQEEPVVISLTDLIPVEDQNSEYGFSSRIKDDAKLIIASAYGTGEWIRRFNFYDSDGIPIPDRKGAKFIYKTTTGVASVFSDSSLDAGSNDSHLANSSSIGRVAVGSFVPQNYIEVRNAIQEGENQIAKIKKDLEDRVAEL